MLGNLLAYAADRAATGAVESLSKRVGWYVAGVFVLLLACFFAVLTAFWLLEPIYGPIVSAALIAVGSLVIALICFAVPTIGKAMDRRRVIQQAKAAAGAPAQSSVSQMQSAVQEEAAEAVDYFGPMRVVASAFMMGLGAGRQIRQLRSG